MKLSKSKKEILRGCRDIQAWQLQQVEKRRAAKPDGVTLLACVVVFLGTCYGFVHLIAWAVRAWWPA